MKISKTVRKTTLRELGNAEDREYWRTIPQEDRMAEAWKLTEEVWRFSGRDPGPQAGARQKVAIVKRQD